MISFWVILGLVVLAIYLLFLINGQAKDFMVHKRSNNFIDFKTVELSNNEDFGSSDFFVDRIGHKYQIKFFVPVIFISLVSVLVLGPLLTNFYYGILLGLVISCAYSFRIFFHLAQNFREELLSQIENILRQIRNHLSSGASLDYALNLVRSQVLQIKPIGKELNKYLKSIESNFFDAFPQWLYSLKAKYQLADLGDSAQLLALELKYTNNQEQAFLNAINSLANRIVTNKKNQNLIAITFLSLDFMVLAFLAVIFYVIPSFSLGLENSWWESSRRILVIFISGLILWFCYLITIFIALRRLA